MDAAAELGRNPVSKHQIQPEYGDEEADAGRYCRARLARQGNIYFPCSAGHEQDWQPYDGWDNTKLAVCSVVCGSMEYDYLVQRSIQKKFRVVMYKNLTVTMEERVPKHRGETGARGPSASGTMTSHSH